jgi:hypothetical protein
MNAFKVAFHGATRNSEAAARSMMRLLLPLLGNHWRLGNTETSDVVILDAGSLEELNRRGAARASALYVVLEKSGSPPANAFCVLRYPLNSTQLVEALHRAQAELERRQGGASPTTTLPPAGFGSGSSEAERGIRTSMRTAVRWMLQDVAVAATLLNERDEKILSALPERGFTSRLTSTEIADLLRKNGLVKLLNLNEDEQAALVARKRTFEPMIRLEWIYWLTDAKGDLRPGLNLTRPYRLRQWPDFSRLPHYRSDVRMASLLMAEPLTVGALAARAGVRLETACNFVNGCAALDLLGGVRPRPRTVTGGMSPAQATAGGTDRREPTGLMGAIRSALGLDRKPHDPTAGGA